MYLFIDLKYVRPIIRYSIKNTLSSIELDLSAYLTLSSLQRFIFNSNVKTHFFPNIDNTIHPFQEIFRDLLISHFLHSPEFGLRPLKCFKNIFFF